MRAVPGTWKNISDLDARAFEGGHCGHYMSSSAGWYMLAGGSRALGYNIYVCSHCNRPTLFEKSQGGELQSPGPTYGAPVTGLPASVGGLYDEARRCVTVSAYTSAVLACRKLLMNIAVEKGADEGKSFIAYIEYLASEGFVPPGGEAWVDHIRKRGNEATHEIAMKTDADARDLIAFAEMLLKFVYEFPGRVPQPSVS